MQKVLDIKLLTFDGKPVKDGPGENAPDLTFAMVIAGALQAPLQENIPIETQIKRGLLAQRVIEAGSLPCELSIDNLALIREYIGKVYKQPLIIARTISFLEADADQAQPEKLKAVQ